MTQRSRFWEGTTIGDAVVDAPYDGSTETAQLLMGMSGTNTMPNKGGVCFGALNSLAPTVSSQTVSIDTGEALVYGAWFQNDVLLATALAIPASATRIDRFVLRKDWTLQTIRITKLAGVEGGGEPALVQNVGVQWDVPLVKASITTGGVVTLTDERQGVGASELVTVVGPLTVAQANILLTLPGGFNVCEIDYFLQSSSGVSADHVDLTMNGDGGANYNNSYMKGVNTTVTAAVTTAGSIMPIGVIGNTTNTKFGAGRILIPSYANSTQPKSVTAISSLADSVAAKAENFIGGGTWSSTSPITTITMTPDLGGSFVIGSLVIMRLKR